MTNAEFIINNTGNAVAKNVIVTIQAPYIITKHIILSSENSTEQVSPGPYILQVSIPRFAQGGGSFTTDRYSIR